MFEREEEAGMPAEHSWEEESRILRTRLWGRVTIEDIIRDALKVYADLRIHTPIQELIDLREVESTDVTIDDLRRLVQLNVNHAERFRGRRQAMVAPTDELRSMAQTFVTLSEVHLWPHLSRIFNTLSEAEDWLTSVGSEGNNSTR